ncbi:MAG TPA: T9SS type A sorting domain-containing protein, partial [Bacteroidales bacterium]|nr:T9SS type A sorting domain-containing protein [Bacteroidales bacterium]
VVVLPRGTDTGERWVRILDLTGKVVSEKRYTTAGQSIKLDASALRNGIYIAEVILENGTGLRQRWVVQH